MAKLDLKKSSKGLTFFTRFLTVFGSKTHIGDQNYFDRRGAITITDKQITKKNGEIIKIRAIADSGGSGTSMAMYRPGSDNEIDEGKLMKANHGWAYAAIKAISEEIGNIEFKVCRIKKDGKIVEVEEHPLLDFIDSFNEFQTGSEFKQVLAMHLELVGNAYIFLPDVKSENDTPTSMFLLDPSKVKIFFDKSTFPWKIAYFEYQLEIKNYKFQPYQIVQIKYPDPSNPYKGKGTVEGIAEWIDNDNYSAEFLRMFFKNGAQVGVTFETDMTSEEQLQELRDSFNEQHSGTGNAWKGLFLPKGVKKPTSDTKFSDVGLPELADHSRDKILAGFRVSKTILGTAESDTNRSTAETADYVFGRRTIRPKMILIVSYLNEFLTPRFKDDSIFLSFLDPTPEDLEAKSLEMKNSVSGLPTMTINEVRDQYLNMPPIEGGDNLVMPNNYARVSDIEKGNAQPLNPASPEDPEKDDKYQYPTRPINAKLLGYIPKIRKGKIQSMKNAQIRKDLSDSISEKILKIISSNTKKLFADMTNKEFYDVVYKSRSDLEKEYVKKIKEKMIEINKDQKKEVMDKLRREMKSVKALDPKNMFDVTKWVNITVDSITPLAKELFGKEAVIAFEAVDWDKPGHDIANDPNSQEAIANAMSLMSRSYNEDTVMMLEEKLTEGIEAGYGVDKMGELITDIYAWKNKYAAERVALTESNRIANEASKIAWKKTGIVSGVQWVTSGNADVCQFCREQEGKIVSIDDNFFNQGDTIDGEDGGTTIAKYSDIGGPPMHPNCHCAIRPIRDTSKQIDQKEIDGMDEDIETALIDEALTELEKNNDK